MLYWDIIKFFVWLFIQKSFVFIFDVVDDVWDDGKIEFRVIFLVCYKFVIIVLVDFVFIGCFLCSECVVVQCE